MLKFDEKKLLSLLNDFHKLTGTKICVIGEDGREIVCVPEEYCEFCSYVRSSPEGLAACKRSDDEAFKTCRKQGKLYRYTCHMGLTECITPILQGGSCIGFVMLGQTTGDKGGGELTKKRAAEYGLDPRRAEELYAKINFVDEDKLAAAISIMEACTSYLYLNKLIHSEKSVAVKIEDYIGKHLADNLSVTLLCREFKLSRVDLYSCFDQMFGLTPAEYIKEARLREACRLLRETDLKITAVAVKVGIADYNYFSKIFKKAMNMSPREYRKGNIGETVLYH